MKIAYVLVLVFYLPHFGFSQNYLQLERYHHVKNLNYVEGSTINFKIKNHPDAWRTGVIDRISIQDSIIFLKDDFFHMTDITHLRTYNPMGFYIANIWKTLSISWTAFAAVGWIDNEFKPQYEMLVLGGAIFTIHWWAKRFLTKNTYRVGKNNRLRLLDLNFPLLVS